MEFAYLARTNDTLAETYWVALEGYLGHMVREAGYRRFWAQNEASYYADSVDYLAVVSTCNKK